MRILAFDTATPLTSVALRDIGEQANVCLRTELDLTAVDDPTPGARPGHAQKLLSLIERLLEEGATSWEEIDRLAVGVGPGTFTGLRIGIATAHALAQSTGIPLVAVSTLASLETATRAGGPVLAVIDARRGEAFIGGTGVEAQVVGPEQLGAIAGRFGGGRAGAPGNGVTAVGDGAVKFRELLERAGATVPPDESPLHRVSARQHCRLAALLRPSPTGMVEPQYMRVPDAELSQRP